MFITNVLTVVLMAAASGPSPIACNLKALTPADRAHHAVVGGKLRSAVVSREELPDGFSYRLKPSATNLAELADWVDAEKRCCPFLDFRITVEREGRGLLLALTGRQGVKEFLSSEFANWVPTK